MSGIGVAAAEETRARTRHSVRHFLANFKQLEERYPGQYPRMIVRGDGAYVWDDMGHRLLDAGGHLGATQIGHGRSVIGERMARQVAELEYISLDGGLSHPKSLELAEVLAPLVPLDDPKISFTLSGSEANELALKIARAYHSRRGDDRRVVVLSREGSYHGSTYGGISAAGVPVFRAGFGPTLPAFAQVPQPSPGRCGFCAADEQCTLRCADALEQSVEEHGPENIAAIMGEPVSIFGAVKIPHPEYWTRVQEIRDSCGALLIVDEVVTGFGRTGRMFGCEHWDIRPDIMTVAKGLTSGYVPMGATIVAREVEEAFTDQPLLHINTYAGHPVACEAGIANLEILIGERLAENAASLEGALRRELEQIEPFLGRRIRVSVIGLLSSVEVEAADVDDGDTLVMAIRHAMYERGVIARASYAGGILTVVFYPVLTVGERDVVEGVEALKYALGDVLAA
jgi:adenosylmethionine-8-amino-7-oxononanoate aminotransferase